MAAAVVIQSSKITDISQRILRIIGTLKISGTPYPAGAVGIPLDSVISALPEAQGVVKRVILTSLTGTGYIYQRLQTGNLMILQVPPNGSLTTAAPLQEIPSSLNMQGINNDLIDFEAELLRG
jgi:hypothetical protein